MGGGSEDPNIKKKKMKTQISDEKEKEKKKTFVGGSAGAHYRNHARDGTGCERVFNIFFLYFFAAGRAGMGRRAPLDEAAFL